MRVKFLMNKRYPHPNGTLRREGEIHEVDDATAQLWLERNVVERASADAEVDKLPQKRSTDPSADSKNPQPSGDLRQTTDAAPTGPYEDYGDETVDEVLAKLDAGTYDPEQVRGLENTRHGGPRKGVLEALGAE